MHSPVCEVCLNSDILCQGCSGRLERGEISKAELDVSRFLHELCEKAPSLKEATIRKIVDGDVLLVITAKGDGAKVVGKGGTVVKALAKQWNKSVRVLEEKDTKQFMLELLHPVTVLGINTLYTPGGEVMRVRVSSGHNARSVMTPEGFSSIMNQVFGKKTELVFE